VPYLIYSGRTAAHKPSRNNIILRKVISTLGLIISFCGLLGGIVLTIVAGNAAGVTFMNIIFTSRWSQFVLFWNYSPTLYILAMVCAIGGALLALVSSKDDE
jgi:ABC-type antimicrobial peptide transport system permease subunit